MSLRHARPALTSFMGARKPAWREEPIFEPFRVDTGHRVWLRSFMAEVRWYDPRPLAIEDWTAAEACALMGLELNPLEADDLPSELRPEPEEETEACAFCELGLILADAMGYREAHDCELSKVVLVGREGRFGWPFLWKVGRIELELARASEGRNANG